MDRTGVKIWGRSLNEYSMKMLKRKIKALLNNFGLDIIRHNKSNIDSIYPEDYESHLKSIIKRVEPFTYTSHHRIQALCNATTYIVNSNIPGAVVECGVWKGGSIMASMLTLLELKKTDRDFSCTDTFEGMAEPGENDTLSSGGFALDTA